MSPIFTNRESLSLDWWDTRALVTKLHQRSNTPGRRLRVRDAHLVGVGGSGMRALAEFMRDVGIRVTGSDSTLREDQRWQMHVKGLRVCSGHAEAHLPDETDLLVYSPAVGANNPERCAAERIGIQQLSLPQALGWLMNLREGISVCGTHGKSSTTALLGHLLETAGFAPSVIGGGESISRTASGWAGAGKSIVVESCEYRRHFLNLTPHHAILLNVEPDHFDCFPSMSDAIDAYAQFVRRIPDDGTLVINADSSGALAAVRGARCRLVTVGRSPSADWTIAGRQATGPGWTFRLQRRGELFSHFRLPSPVKHNVANAAAAIVMARCLGVARHHLRQGVQTFAGVRRRYEQIGTYKGVTLIDDYAHHPTAIAGVLRTVRQRFANRKIWCAFQPHQVSRTTELMSQFATSLRCADELLVPPVFAARETVGSKAIEISHALVCAATKTGIRSRFVSSLDEIRQTIETEARPGDVFLILGAGDIDSVSRDLAQRLAVPQAG